MTDLMKKYEGYSVEKGTFTARKYEPQDIEESLPPGTYTGSIDRYGNIHFNERKTNYDQILDLPSPEYTQLMSDITAFMDPKTKLLFESFGFLYKRSCLLGGAPGTGKTVLINRISEKVVEMGGVVLVSPDPYQCRMMLDALDATQPDVLKLIIFEEFDRFFEYDDDDTEAILSLLDGGIQSSNVMYMATTNYLEKIPARIKRPGRFSTVINMQMPNAEARKSYLESKIGKAKGLAKWVKDTNGLSIDELKETVLAHKCLKQPLDLIIRRIRKTRPELEEAEVDNDELAGNLDTEMVRKKIKAIQKKITKKRRRG